MEQLSHFGMLGLKEVDKMGKVVIDMSMSLDGFIVGLQGNQEGPLGEGSEVFHN